MAFFSACALRLRQLNKTRGKDDAGPSQVGSNDPALKQKIDQWVQNIVDIHRKKPPAQVSRAPCVSCARWVCRPRLMR